MQNLSELLIHRREHQPPPVFGSVGHQESYVRLFDRAAALAALLTDSGVKPSDRVLLAGENSPAFLTMWMSLQLAGAEVALINPAYPLPLTRDMCADLSPSVVVTTDAEAATGITEARWIDASGSLDGALAVDGERLVAGSHTSTLPGAARRSDDLAGFMHTSGTTGRPRWCAQSHEYFLRLGRFIADAFVLSMHDTVFTPLPLFHINPLGYGVVGALTGASGLLFARRFSAREFWPTVVSNGVTVVILHAPPAEILKRTSAGQDSHSHRVRLAFFADPEFLDQFEIPVGVSGYGSTEGGGLSHTWLWRRGDSVAIPEGPLRYGGHARHDLEWKIDADGGIAVRGRRSGVLFSGYLDADNTVVQATDDDGWFATGDLGRHDERGNLVFLERASECVRVRGEYVPVDFVERHFTDAPGVADVAVWRRPGDLGSDEVVLFVVADALDVVELQRLTTALPRFMQPAAVARVASLPRDTGVGKLRRRELRIEDALEVVDLR